MGVKFTQPFLPSLYLDGRENSESGLGGIKHLISQLLPITGKTPARAERGGDATECASNERGFIVSDAQRETGTEVGYSKKSRKFPQQNLSQGFIVIDIE